MRAKFVIEGSEEIIKLLDKASSLIEELKDVSITLQRLSYPNSTRILLTHDSNSVNEEDSK